MSEIAFNPEFLSNAETALEQKITKSHTSWRESFAAAGRGLLLLASLAGGVDAAQRGYEYLATAPEDRQQEHDDKRAHAIFEGFMAVGGVIGVTGKSKKST